MEKFPRKSRFRAVAGFGIILIAVGVATKSYGLMGAGLAFLIFGLLKKRKVERT